jgi:hypothetical protein
MREAILKKPIKAKRQIKFVGGGSKTQDVVDFCEPRHNLLNATLHSTMEGSKKSV